MKRLLLLLTLSSHSVFLFAQSGLVIYPGAHLVKSGNPSLVLNNMDFINNGSFTPANGTVKLSGTNAIAVKGNNPISFYDVYENSSLQVKLEQRTDLDRRHKWKFHDAIGNMFRKH